MGVNLLALIATTVGGAVLATVVSVGVVSTQTGAPDTNPANQEILTYGDR